MEKYPHFDKSCVKNMNGKKIRKKKYYPGVIHVNTK